ncbi:hypothetical protein ACTXGU_00030 [Niallia sp. 01092]|uniref:hypothetical protein n=1 Tax=Niallia sp. 01092 TaxID=3457759 RepID=UPI003FCEF28D
MNELNIDKVLELEYMIEALEIQVGAIMGGLEESEVRIPDKEYEFYERRYTEFNEKLAEIKMHILVD